MVQYMLVSRKMVLDKGLEKQYMLMAAFMMASGKMTKNMEMVSTNI